MDTLQSTHAMLLFKIDGAPLGKQRPRFARRGNFVATYTPKKTSDYEEVVRIMCRREMSKNGIEGWFDNEPLMVAITAYYPILNSYSKVVKKGIELGHILPTKKPDWDNIGKIVCDSLNGVAYKDDAQIVTALVQKKYGEPRVEVAISEAVCD